jgi:hypothetical protein
MNDIGPDAVLEVLEQSIPAGRNLLNEYPIPHPACCRIPERFKVLNILDMLSSIGSTTQFGISCPFVPASERVLPPGKKYLLFNILRNEWYSSSVDDIPRDTRSTSPAYVDSPEVKYLVVKMYSSNIYIKNKNYLNTASASGSPIFTTGIVFSIIFDSDMNLILSLNK